MLYGQKTCIPHIMRINLINFRRKEHTMSKWHDKSCEECGTTIHVHEDWDHAPRFCADCKAERAAKWYDKSCEKCGATINACRDWDHPPKYCADCKAKQDAKWYEVSCENCGTTINACRDWERPPKFCSRCKTAHSPIDASCSHCGASFTISTGTQIQCKKQGWELPKRCEICRQLFKHKPFKTVRETTLTGSPIFRTYNSLGQLIGESTDGKGLFGDERRVHRSHTGKPTGVTRKVKSAFGTQYNETRGTDGRVKSTSRERTGILGDKYTESTGGTSGIKHVTRTVISWFGKKFRKTE